MDVLVQNFAEFARFLVDCGIGIENTGHAAQAVADYYWSRDGWSAAEMEGVLFAYGDRVGPDGQPIATPSYWPYPNDKTYFEDQADQGLKPEETPDLWSPIGEPVTSPDGLTTTYYGRNQRGERRKITIKTMIEGDPHSPQKKTMVTTIEVWHSGGSSWSSPDETSTVTTNFVSSPLGGQYTTTTPLKDGKTQIETMKFDLSGSGHSGAGPATATTLTTIVGTDGTTTVGSKTVTSGFDEHGNFVTTTTTYDADGHVDSKTVDVFDRNEVRTIAETSYDDAGKVNGTQTLAYGTDTPAADPVVTGHTPDFGQETYQQTNVANPPDPLTEAIDEINNREKDIRDLTGWKYPWEYHLPRPPLSPPLI
jgi:hypothetical protein